MRSTLQEEPLAVTECGGTRESRASEERAARPVRVLFVGSATELGGAETALLTLLRSLHAEKVCAQYASLEFGEGPMPERVSELGVRVHRLPRGRLRDLRATVRKIRALAQLIRAEKIDVVVSNSGHPLLVARPGAWLARRPCVWWVHIYDSAGGGSGEWLALAQEWLGADLLLANSEHTARLLRKGVAPVPPVKLLRPGVDTRSFHPALQEGADARRALGVAPGELLVGIFGRLQPWKGQHTFLEAAAKIAREFPQCRFALVGGSLFGLDLEYARQIKQRAEQSDLRGRVLFLGHRADTNALCNACDVVVHASVKPEPWGLVVAEAMSSGRAVIAAAAGGPLEMIQHGRTGLLSPPGDFAALAGNIAQLLRDAGLRESLGAAARVHAVEHFDSRTRAGEFAAAMQELVGKST